MCCHWCTHTNSKVEQNDFVDNIKNGKFDYTQTGDQSRLVTVRSAVKRHFKEYHLRHCLEEPTQSLPPFINFSFNEKKVGKEDSDAELSDSDADVSESESE